MDYNSSIKWKHKDNRYVFYLRMIGGRYWSKRILNYSSHNSIISLMNIVNRKKMN